VNFAVDIALQFSQFVLPESAVNLCSLPVLFSGFILAADALVYWCCSLRAVVVF